MTKRGSNIKNLLDGLKDNPAKPEISKESDSKVARKPSNPTVALATNTSVRRASSIKEPVLSLSHDQVRFFKYHDRHESTLDTVKVSQIRVSIEAKGQHTPGIVRKTEDTTPDGRLIYELVVGRIRFEASKGVGVFKAFLKDLDDADATRLMFSENEDRQNITPFERWLSVIPLVKDNVIEAQEIASLVSWDKGNLSRYLKAIKVYEECKLERYLVDVLKVKMNTLIELSALYESQPKEVRQAISYIEDNYSTLKNSLFVKAVMKRVVDTEPPITQTLFLAGSKVTIKKHGESVTLSFKGIPNESEFAQVIDTLKELKALN
jgi:ParB family chromosome partitioning protein